jgi:hypothetical protein
MRLIHIEDWASVRKVEWPKKSHDLCVEMNLLVWRRIIRSSEERILEQYGRGCVAVLLPDVWIVAITKTCVLADIHHE